MIKDFLQSLQIASCISEDWALLYKSQRTARPETMDCQDMGKAHFQKHFHDFHQLFVYQNAKDSYSSTKTVKRNGEIEENNWNNSQEMYQNDQVNQTLRNYT